LMSPMLVVAYALAGRVDIDLINEPLSYDSNQEPVYLKDIWPSNLEISEETVRVILTGYADVTAAMAAINTGNVFRFICKPWVDEELKLTIRQAADQYALATQNKRWSQLTQKQNDELNILNQRLETLVDERTRQLVQSKDNLSHTLLKLQKTLTGVIQSIALIVEIRDPYTAGHQQRVSVLASAIAGEMGFSKDRIDGIRLSALIHDMGKIAVPAEILSKPGRLNDLEFNMMVGMDFEDISIWINYNTEKESTGFLETEKGSGAQVRGLHYHNQFLKEFGITNKYNEIRIGDTVRYCYINPTNGYGIDVISFIDGSFPDEFREIFTIDYITMFNKLIGKPLAGYVEAMGFDEFKPSNQMRIDIFNL